MNENPISTGAVLLAAAALFGQCSNEDELEGTVFDSRYSRCAKTAWRLAAAVATYSPYAIDSPAQLNARIDLRRSEEANRRARAVELADQVEPWEQPPVGALPGSKPSEPPPGAYNPLLRLKGHTA